MITYVQVSVQGERIDGEVVRSSIRNSKAVDEDIIGCIEEFLASNLELTELQVWVTYWWIDQCNIAFEASVIGALAAKNCVLCVSCIEGNPDEE